MKLNIPIEQIMKLTQYIINNHWIQQITSLVKILSIIIHFHMNFKTFLVRLVKVLQFIFNLLLVIAKNQMHRHSISYKIFNYTESKILLKNQL